MGTSPLNRSRFEKALADHGFDLTPSAAGEWLLGRSTQHPILVWLRYEGDGSMSLGSTSLKLRRAMIDEGFTSQREETLPGGGGWSLASADFSSLYRALGRFAALARTLPNQVAERFAAATRQLPQSTEVERLVVQRVGQDLFREALIDFWEGRCAVTGLDVVPLLRASHIKPWAVCESNEERLDVFNGLLLAPHLDALFDGGWITIGDNGKFLISNRLSPRARELLNVHEGCEAGRISQNHQDYLRYHRIEVFR